MLKMRLKKPDAKELLKRSSLRYSKPREIILSVLLKAQKPLTAMEVLQETEALQTEEKFWLSTIYRNLEYLLEAKLLTRIDLPNSTEAAYIAKTDHSDMHYAICLTCHKIFPLRLCPVEDAVRQLSLKGFRTQSHRVELFGYCEDCYALLRSKAHSSTN